jgi:hypothetical protein
MYAAYHSAINFTRPKEFIPDRWLSDPLPANLGLVRNNRDIVKAVSYIILIIFES